MDREKAINGLEHCKRGYCAGCPYDLIREESLHGKHDKWGLVCNEQLTEDILALLKEQEALEPRNTYSTTPSGKVIPHIFCGKCNKEIYAIYAFCPFCGQAVKWE